MLRPSAKYTEVVGKFTSRAYHLLSEMGQSFDRACVDNVLWDQL